ncbi:hypothetical protein K431DRAFT_280573 [Polychaeton citri CBS 116435]|uniref:Exoribonuclease phosphorolytic domain-containing protein n=1 Tax=Polychaeton citri CBS 116435 TaxID=1314669 RepID=A0A9P4UT89_9PEZI|nr:hypothetical protein K431DRAFT_280573 [Polychaeton citri CBS 116435]
MCTLCQRESCDASKKQYSHQDHTTLAMAVPETQSHSLSRADGSATFTSSLHSILAAVNGPVEVGRRDELPEEAAIEVNIRPVAGVGGPRERWLESIVQAVLRSVVLVHMHPRTLIQITLQITQEPGEEINKRDARDVVVIPDLLNAASLALVDAGIPLNTAVSATLAVVAVGDEEIVLGPTVDQVVKSTSVHAFGYDRQGGMLLSESTGHFALEKWEQAEGAARTACAAALAPTGGDEAMGNGGIEGEPWIRQALEEKVRDANAWREST